MSSSPDGSQLRQSFALVLHATSVLLQIVEYIIVLLFPKTGRMHCSAAPPSVRCLHDWLFVPAAEPVPRNARCAS